MDMLSQCANLQDRSNWDHMRLISLLDRHYYPGVEDNWDDKEFRSFVLERLSGHDQLLDLGAGAGILPAMNFRGHAARICGIDPDERVTTNPCLDEGRVGFGEQIPYPNETFDVVIADNVMEHLTSPEQVLSEVKRVLKPGGRFLFKTPNSWHYMPVIARLTPHKFHQWFNKLRGRNSTDTFPTVYLVNTPANVRRVAMKVGLTPILFSLLESRPEYMRVTLPTYVIGILYEQLVNALLFLAPFRILLIGELKKEPQL